MSTRKLFQGVVGSPSESQAFSTATFFGSCATSAEATWQGNFRDLAASVTRMATLSPKGRIDLDGVEAEIRRLRHLWSAQAGRSTDILAEFLDEAALAEIDLFERTQLAKTIRVCRNCRSLSEAGRILFNVSRTRRSSANDADRLRKYLARFNLDWSGLTKPHG